MVLSDEELQGENVHRRDRYKIARIRGFTKQSKEKSLIDFHHSFNGTKAAKPEMMQPVFMQSLEFLTAHLQSFATSSKQVYQFQTMSVPVWEGVPGQSYLKRVPADQLKEHAVVFPYW